MTREGNMADGPDADGKAISDGDGDLGAEDASLDHVASHPESPSITPAATSPAPAQDPASITESALAAQAQSNSLERASFAMISRSQKPATTSALSGNLQRNETLYAVAWASKNKRVDNDATWSYQWLYGSSTSALDFAPIEGQTSSSLVLTDELRTQLDGKYLRVRISCGDVSIDGPKRPTAYRSLTA